VVNIQTFTYKETQYLRSLLKRNISSHFENNTTPLSKPMHVDERKLRSRISKKCETYISELVLAELAGLLPSKKMKKSKYRTVSEAIAQLGYGMLLLYMQES